ncbi:hypothetical protein DEIPH_ctg008orf0144 [Deinococcus phoenicis]|uniref:Uncharacterized protein n=1 Tax=Deinococcus phoenicis TaxID=1476583 RepID=A0A016QUD7_9DEIO|nr:hypothetical protein [Deinococcus phoenicis]EYB69409.1 hypothetical protein DEIPH_ctg008orf0144 [Deinococcus phoenicis]
MKTLLTALLLAVPAAHAQTVQPASVPAASTPAATTALRLTAQPGTSVQLTTSVRTQLTLEDLQVTGPGGQKMEAAQLARMRADIQRGLSGAATQTTAVKTFYKVQGRAADGTVTLLNTAATSVPGQPAINIRIVQTVAPNGQTRVTRAESDNPAVQSALQALSPEVLRAQVNTGGSDLTSLYGQTFTAGQPRTQTTTVDAQALMGSLIGALTASLGEGNPLGNVKASPLTVRTTTTYRGTAAGGQRIFDVSSNLGTWTVELGDLQSKTMPLRMRLELLGGQQSGQSLYRPDGLPAGQSMTQTMRMRMTMTQPDGSQMQMVLRLNQNMQAR